MKLIFVDAYGNGQYRMRVPPVELLSAIDVVKSNMNMGLKNVRNLLKFDVSFKEVRLRIDIPVKKISFQEKEGKMTAAFRVKVTLYKDYVKKDSQTTAQTLSEDKEQLLNKKTLQIAIPYDLKEKGKYYFEIVLVNLQSGSAYRHYLNYKI